MQGKRQKLVTTANEKEKINYVLIIIAPIESKHVCEALCGVS